MRFAIIALALLAAALSPARALDMSTQTCRDWLDAEEEVQDQMAAWLRGYLSGRATSTIYDPARSRADVQLLRAYCQAHQEIGVISAASQWGR